MNILSATVSTTSDRLALSRFVFEMGDTTAPGPRAQCGPADRPVYDVYRVNAG